MDISSSAWSKTYSTHNIRHYCKVQRYLYNYLIRFSETTLRNADQTSLMWALCLQLTVQGKRGDGRGHPISASQNIGYSHLDAGSIQIMFSDFSRTFNIIQSLLLRDKVLQKGCTLSWCPGYCTDYFTERPFIWLTDCSSGTVISSTATQQDNTFSCPVHPV